VATPEPVTAGLGLFYARQKSADETGDDSDDGVLGKGGGRG
jgi:hypothetical protein